MSQRYQLTPSNANGKPTSIALSPLNPRTSSRASSNHKVDAPVEHLTKHTNTSQKQLDVEDDFDDDFDDFGSGSVDGTDMSRPPLHRPADGRSHQPLLHKEDDEERGRAGYATSPDLAERPPLFTRRSTMRSRSPDTQAKLATRKKYTYAAFFLGLSLISFVIQTETAVYIQHELGWNKAYCML